MSSRELESYKTSTYRTARWVYGDAGDGRWLWVGHQSFNDKSQALTQAANDNRLIGFVVGRGYFVVREITTHTIETA